VSKQLEELKEAIESTPAGYSKNVNPKIVGWRMGDIIICHTCEGRLVNGDSAHLIVDFRAVWEPYYTIIKYCSLCGVEIS